MNAQLARTHRLALAIAITLGCGAHAFAGPELMAVDAPFRAKIAKEKIRTSAQERKTEAAQKKSADDSQCGSQSIGNLDVGGRSGPAPREVFVFAPNAINVVGRGSCR